MGDRVDCALGCRRCRSDGYGDARPLVLWTDLQRLELVAELLHGGGAGMGFRRLLVAPGFEDGELVGALDALENVEALVAPFLAARRGELLQKARGLGFGG